ncbi:MAG TPA: hypothetical protein VLJ76_03160 [Gaiellaceae bacterium]|nr:hypothetical protein [Gaiellaceae bacterium]
MRPSFALGWWVVAGVAELAIAILLLAEGYWYSIFGTAPATAICAYFARRELDRRNRG